MTTITHERAAPSGTRRDDLLMSPQELTAVDSLRRAHPRSGTGR
jgi:transcription termination factor Rho